MKENKFTKLMAAHHMLENSLWALATIPHLNNAAVSATLG